MVKNLPANAGDKRDTGLIPGWKSAWQPIPLFLPGESQGQKSLAGYSPQGRKESDTTEVMGFKSGTSVKEPACHCRRSNRCEFNPWVREDPLEEGMATHSSIPAWKIPWTEEPGGLHSS